MPRLENPAIPAATAESWRTWMMTGAITTAVSRRRMRGAHAGLKKILVEGRSNGNGHGWDDFSGAMLRHNVDDAIRSLSPEEMQVLKLAYFGGYSNRQIAREVGVREWTVKRRLTRALHALSEHLEYGRAIGRRVVYAILLFLSGKWLSDVAQNTWQAAAVAGVAVVIATGPTPSPATTTAPPQSHQTAASTHAAPSPAPVVPSRAVPTSVPPAQVPIVDGSVHVTVPLRPLPPLIKEIENLL